MPCMEMNKHQWVIAGNWQKKMSKAPTIRQAANFFLFWENLNKHKYIKWTVKYIKRYRDHKWSGLLSYLNDPSVLQSLLKSSCTSHRSIILHLHRNEQTSSHCHRTPVMGKSQIKSHTQISNPSRKVCRSVSQISIPIFSQIPNFSSLLFFTKVTDFQ